MAPLPKKRHAKSRTRRRKSTKRITLPNFGKCPNCGSLKLSHIACKNCGYTKDEKKDRSKTQTAD